MTQSNINPTASINGNSANQSTDTNHPSDCGNKQPQTVADLDAVGTLHHDGGTIDKDVTTHQFKRITADMVDYGGNEKLRVNDQSAIINELTPESLLTNQANNHFDVDEPKPAPQQRSISQATTLTDNTNNTTTTTTTQHSSNAPATHNNNKSLTIKISSSGSSDNISAIQPIIQPSVINQASVVPLSIPYPQPSLDSLYAQQPARNPYYVMSQPVMGDAPVTDNGSSLHSVAHLIRDNNNVVIKFLPQSFTQDSLQSLCEPFGDILSCRLIRDRNSGVSLGYGFVTFDNDIGASRAVSSLNGLPIENKILRAALARPITPAQIQQNNYAPINHTNNRIKQNIYVAGLPRSYTVDDLNKLFGKYGMITESRILLDRMGQSRGVGFVRYTNNECAGNAIEALNGTQLQASDELLVVRHARDSSSIPNTRHIDDTQPTFNNLYNMHQSPPQQYIQHQSIDDKQQWQPPYTQTHTNNTNTNVFNFTPHGMDTVQQQQHSYINPSAQQSPSNNPMQQQFSPYNAYQHSSGPPLPSYYQPQQVYSQISSPTYPNTPTSLLAQQVAQSVTMTPAVTPSHAHTQHDTHKPLDQSFVRDSHDSSVPNDSPRLEARRSFDRTGVSLFVFHLPSDMSDSELHQLFSTAGPVLSAKVMINNDMQQSKGYGFVNFATVQAAHHAITRFNGKKLGGKFLKVSLKQRR